VSKEVGPDINPEKANYMFRSHQENARQNHNMKTANKSLENMTKFKYLGVTLEIKIICTKELRRD